jgi:hypothetical protein
MNKCPQIVVEVEGSEAPIEPLPIAQEKALIPKSPILLTERLRCLRAPNNPLRIGDLAGNVTGIFMYTPP